MRSMDIWSVCAMGKTVPVPLEEVAGKLKMVDPKDPLIQEIKDMGICFGDSL